MNNKLDVNRYESVKILSIRQYNPKLMSFKIERPKDYTFKAGQFSKLGFIKDNEEVWRAYSPGSAEDETEFLEFYVILIEQGVMSNFFMHMKVGDTILLWKEANGFLIPDLFNEKNKDLVLFSTGSGITPFMPMLFKEEVWKTFNSITLIHSVSYAKELIYDEKIATLINHQILSKYQAKFTYQRIVTRESFAGALNKRVTEVLENGELEKALNTDFTIEKTRFMLCGNPTMVKSTFAILKDRGFKLHRKKEAGQIIMEHAF